MRDSRGVPDCMVLLQILRRQRLPIALHWDRTTRQQLELPLLQFYHEALISAGISSYSFDDLLVDYRRCLVRNLTIPILFWSRGQPRESWRHRLDCALAAYRDHHCAELL